MIRVENLSKRYKGKTALASVSFSVGAGEIFAYLGPNGAGKTTTIRLLTGASRPDAGDAWLGGHHVFREPVKAKSTFGLVSQAFSLDRDLSVRENWEIHCRLRGVSGREKTARMAWAMEYVGLEECRDALVKDLSGGQKRRVMIGRALLHEPRVLFLDEPSVGLDPAIRKRLWGLIKQIKADGRTVFLTTHYIEEAEFLADRAAFLDAGSIVADDSPAALMDSIGQWAVDELDGGEMRSEYFRDKAEAEARAARASGGYAIRRVNLEDAFLRMTGKRCSTCKP